MKGLDRHLGVGDPVLDQGEHLLARGLVGLGVQVELAGEAAAVHPGVPAADLAVGVEAHEALPGQERVGTQHSPHLDVAVVGDDRDVGLGGGAGVLESGEELAEPAVDPLERLLDLGGEAAGGVAGGVDVDEVEEEHVGRVGAEDVGGDGGVEAAEAVLAVPADLVRVPVDVLAAARGGGLTQHGEGGLEAGAVPDLGDGDVERGRPAGGGPADGGGAQALLLREVEEGGAGDVAGVPEPVGDPLPGGDLLVGVDAVAVGGAAGGLRGVVRVGDGRVDRLGAAPAALEDPGEVREGAGEGHVHDAHRVDGDDQEASSGAGGLGHGGAPPGR